MNQINNHKNSTASCSGDGGAGGIRAGGSLQVKCLQPKLQKFQRPDSKQETVKFMWDMCQHLFQDNCVHLAGLQLL